MRSSLRPATSMSTATSTCRRPLTKATRSTGARTPRTALTHDYEHGGLIWYVDDHNRVTLTLLNHVQDITQKIMLVHEVDGPASASLSR